MTLGEIAAILGGRGARGRDIVLGYSIDSRTLKAGDLFFAIRGPRHNGHEYVRLAFDRGAAGAVVEEEYEPRPGETGEWIRVPDTTGALQQLALAVRRRWGGRVIGVTGSVGKTTTKEMIAAVLGMRYRTLKSAGNLNNHYGVPLTLLRLRPEDDIAVVEMAMSGPGEIALLASLAEPQTGVVTNVAPAHLEFFESVEAIAAAKRELIEHLSPPGVAVLNGDDARVRGFARGFNGRSVTFGFAEDVDYRAAAPGVAQQAGGATSLTEFEVQSAKYSGRFSIPLPGRHNVENALAAIAVAGLFDIPEPDLRSALSAFTPPSQRAETLHLPNGITVVNDVYNSNPRAMERMIETVATWPGAKRRLVVAGEMLELGPSAPEWHRSIGRELARWGVDWVVAVQGDARFFVEESVEAGLPPGQARFFSNAEEAGRFCCRIAEAGDVILVKGSRAVKLERVVEALRRSSAANQ